jgi:hypothetical protein
LASVKRAPLDLRNIHKILRRNDSYPARAAIACGIAVPDGPIDRNRKAIGTDLANVRRADLTRLANRPAGRRTMEHHRRGLGGAFASAENLALEQGGAGWEKIRLRNRASVI